jgi:ribonuclease HI
MGSMGAGFVWLDRSKCGSERIGREEEGTSSGRAEIGAYAAILRRTPDHEDLVTATDSEVLCRVVGRWVGQGGKASLANTADADILEYILAKLAARIAAKSRTFLVKVKAHRGEPLNEGADDLAEAGRELEKEGENSRWQDRTTRVVYPYYDRTSRQWKKGTWTKTVRNAARRGAAESLMEERLQIGANKWWKGLFETLTRDTDGDQQIQNLNWRSDASSKWDMIATGKWIQKAVWNRWVTESERNQPHKTPITSTWTADFLTREGEGRKAIGDWLRDKSVSWKARRRLLQTNAGVFPCEARLQRWGKHPDGICELCKRCREMGLKLLGGRPARGTTGHLQSSVCRLQAPAATGAHNTCFQRVQDDMSKAKSVCRDWEFVSKGTEISLGKFVSEYFTPLTLGLQTGVVSTEDTDEIWDVAKEEAMEKTKGRETRRARADSPMVDETEVEKSFWLSRPDGWVINRVTKKIMLLEFKRTSDCGESYFQDMRRVAEQQHVPILAGLRALAEERGWEIEVVPMVAGQRSVREKEWLEALRLFGIGKEDGQRILGRLGRTLLDEHEKLFGSYWRLTFGPSSSMQQLLGKGISVRTSRPPQGG